MVSTMIGKVREVAYFKQTLELKQNLLTGPIPEAMGNYNSRPLPLHCLTTVDWTHYSTSGPTNSYREIVSLID